jgi:hypothetical protein
MSETFNEAWNLISAASIAVAMCPPGAVYVRWTAYVSARRDRDIGG